MKKTKLKMNKPVYLGFSILEISKTLMYEFWYDYMKPKYGENVKLCYVDTDSFIMHNKTEDFCKDIANDVEERFDTSNFEVHRPLFAGKSKRNKKKYAIKRRLKFGDYKDCILNGEIVLKSQQRFKSEIHDRYTEEINKIALNSNDDKRLQTFDRITSYPYG